MYIGVIKNIRPCQVKDEDGWKMELEGFMAPWQLGKTLEEAKASIREYAGMVFDLSGGEVKNRTQINTDEHRHLDCLA